MCMIAREKDGEERENDLPPTTPFLAGTQSLSLQLRSITKSPLSTRSALRTERSPTGKLRFLAAYQTPSLYDRNR
ncbi:hypothetical protein L1987_54788 [Smallanthus sonchifolius]|uniref:Uncharacterized protein n=1 Tax=Smallanthus sonchifolius TaxID=185202 RepID=A0ACB9E869_9ASTR|nr:hypothetical protein L1987_54788 [Smallanthus sonchifolius]